MGSAHRHFWLAATLVALAALAVSGCVGSWGGAGDIDPQNPVFGGGIAASAAAPVTGQPVALTVNATDPQNQALTYAWSDSSTSAGEFIGAGNTVLWSSNTEGAFTITCTVRDSDGNSTSITTTITVGAGTPGGANQPPAFVDGSGNPLTLEGDVSQPVATQRIRFTTMAIDPDNDPLTYLWTASGGGAFSDQTVDAGSGEAQAFFAADSAGNYTVTVTAYDGKGGSASVSAIASLSSDQFNVQPYPASFSVAGFATCGNCHPGKVIDWQTTNHHDALTRRIQADVPGTYGYRNEHCYDCHAAGRHPVGSGGFIDLELTPGLANIQCESCHGPYSGAGPGHMPMQWDPGKGYETDTQGNYIKDGFSYVYDEDYDGSEGYGCGLCHMGTRHGAYEEYMRSGHANAPLYDDQGEPEHNMTGTSCVQCHNGGWFVKIQINGEEPPAESLTPENFNVMGSAKITCAVCHDPHKAQYEAQLRVSSEETVVIPFDNTVVGPAGRGMICMKCHNGRRTRDDYNGQVAKGSGHFGPHGNPQAPVFWGVMGADLGGPVDYNKDHPHNQLTENACVTCHMFRKDYTSADDPKQFGHEFIPKIEACQACHTNATSLEGLQANLTADVEGLLQDFVDAWPAEWKDVSDPDNPELRNRPSGDGLSDGPPVDDPDGNAYRECLWNYDLVVSDKSMGVHNPPFVRSLLTNSITRLKELSGQIVTPAQAGYVGSSTCLGCHDGNPIDPEAYGNHRHSRNLNEPSSDFIGSWFAGSGDFGGVAMDFSNAGGEYSLGIDGSEYPVQRSLGVGAGKWSQKYVVSHGNSWYVTPAQYNVADAEWVAYKPGDWNGGEPTSPANAFDLRCAGCHTTGINVAYYDESGEWVFGAIEENIKCEACHGPGATHAGSRDPADITNPASDIADYARRIEVCGQCHSRGTSKSLVGGENLMFPFLNGSNFRPGEVLADYYNQEPVLWNDPAGHSRGNNQQFVDFKLSKHYASGFVACWTCHNPHAPDEPFTNALCGQCHSSQANDLTAHAKHAFEIQCIACHMPYTATNAVEYDVRSHAFDIIPPQVSLGMFDADPENVMPNSCMNGGCHGGPDSLNDRNAIETRVTAFNFFFPDFGN